MDPRIFNETIYRSLAFLKWVAIKLVLLKNDIYLWTYWHMGSI